MDFLNITAGRFLFYLGRILELIFDGLIFIINLIVEITVSLLKGFAGLLSLGGCLLILLFAGPLGMVLLLNPVVLMTIALFIIIPILGRKSVSYLKYIKYIVTQYLFDLSAYLIGGKKDRYRTFNEYSNKYRKMEEEKFRQAQRERQERVQREWEERFRKWTEYQGQQRSSGGQEYSWWYGQGDQFGNGQGFINPSSEFINKYQESCKLLDLPYNTDKYQVKLAYRKKAKEFHPDVNRSPDATETFQKINDAYDFLSDGNIERYKALNK